MSSLFKSIARIALPIVGSIVAPGIGTALGSSLSGAALSGIGGALGGAAGGAIGGGGLKGALTGAALGGAGGYISGAGGLANTAQNLGLGTVAHTLPAGVAGPVTAGSGLAGAISNISNSIGSSALGGLLTGGAGKSVTGLLGAGNLAANIYSGVQGTDAYKDMAKAQTQATQQAINLQKPYLQSGVAANTQLSGLLGLDGENKDDILELLRNSPGYQFRMNEGQDALNKSLSARGMVFSGNALREAQELGQGLADQTYNDYVDQLYRQSAAGQGAAGAAGDLYQDVGNIQANKIMGQSNSINSALAGILGGDYGFDQGDDYIMQLRKKGIML